MCTRGPSLHGPAPRTPAALTPLATASCPASISRTLRLWHRPAWRPAGAPWPPLPHPVLGTQALPLQSRRSRSSARSPDTGHGLRGFVSSRERRRWRWGRTQERGHVQKAARAGGRPSRHLSRSPSPVPSRLRRTLSTQMPGGNTNDPKPLQGPLSMRSWAARTPSHLPLSSGAARCPQVTKGDLPPAPAPGATTPS